MKDYCKVLLYIEEIVGGTGLMVSSRVLTREEKRRDDTRQGRSYQLQPPGSSLFYDGVINTKNQL